MKEPLRALDILSDLVVRAALLQAWVDSQPGSIGGHEEGGFILIEQSGKLSVERWPSGHGNSIAVPEHHGCAIKGLPIVATFHTHPNTGSDYLQEPGETDKRGVKEDADLKGNLYVGEFVLAEEMVYLIRLDGTVSGLDKRSMLLV